mgnify:FL=1
MNFDNQAVRVGFATIRSLTKSAYEEDPTAFLERIGSVLHDLCKIVSERTRQDRDLLIKTAATLAHLPDTTMNHQIAGDAVALAAAIIKEVDSRADPTPSGTP